MPTIRATYRLQLHAGFTLRDAAALVPYLARLGVSHVHCSPVYGARAGSTHGYDVTDPTTVNVELGGPDAFAALVEALRAHEMGAVLDVVPNHMATASANARWMDVLENGSASPYARWFDIDWRAAERGLRRRVLVPVLGDRRPDVIARGELRVVFEQGRPALAYWEQRFPLDAATLSPVLQPAVDECIRRLGDDAPCAELREITALLRAVPKRSTRHAPALERRRLGIRAALERLRAVSDGNPAVREALETAAAEFAGGEDGAERLRRLLDAQPYALVHWRRAARELNYRRFFDVNDLIALHMEDPEVFREHHQMVLDWVRAGAVDGLRIDHPDGLLDPAGYLRRLVDWGFAWRPDGRYPVYVEKILAHGERLREGWPVAGTTGYDFLNDVEKLFIDPEGLAQIERDYARITRRRADFAAEARDGKRGALGGGLSAGLRRLAARLQLELPETGRPPVGELATALVETIAALPVYRTYADDKHPSGDDQDRARLSAALDEAAALGHAKPAALAAVRSLLVAEPDAQPEVERARLRLRQRFQQLSGPAAAKGVEDTAAYVHVPLLSRNEVGGFPEAPLGDAVAEFHAANAHRRAAWPHTLLAVTTHDTKRSADVRARLDVLSEVPEAWEERVYHWRRWNRPFTRTVRGRRAPDANAEWLFYQTVVGAWPLEGLDPLAPAPPDEACLATFRARVVEYMRKAVREAKERTSWIDPDLEYESAVERFVGCVLQPSGATHFVRDAAAFAASIARPGLWNSLARTALFLTAPGVPDLYQGDELWNFSLVDPDNRRPVDFTARQDLLARDLAQAPDADALRRLVQTPEDGRLKLHLTGAALALRARRPELFLDGSYEPLWASGPRADRVVAYLRRHGDAALIVAAPRRVRHLLQPRTLLPDPDAWAGTTLHLPGELAGRRFSSALGSIEVAESQGGLPVERLLDPVPAAIFLSEE